MDELVMTVPLTPFVEQMLRDLDPDSPIDKRPLWVVGRFVQVSSLGTVWSFEGVYDNEQRAINACKDETYWVGPCNLNTPTGEEQVSWPGAWFPKAK